MDYLKKVRCTFAIWLKSWLKKYNVAFLCSCYLIMAPFPSKNSDYYP